MHCNYKTYFIILVVCINYTNSTVYLRNKNERGPGAAHSGTQCLATLAKYYFYDILVTRAQNMVVLQTQNLSSPSAEISFNFIQVIHEMIHKGDIQKIQLNIISDNFKIDKLIKVDPQHLTLTDYYIMIVDNYRKLMENIQHFLIRTSAWNPGGRFLILFNNPDLRLNDTNGAEIAFEIFKTMHKKFSVGQVLFCYASETFTYNVYIALPYQDPEKCGTFEPVLIDTCENGIVRKGQKTMEFLRKSHVPKEMSVCTFQFCARVSEPYIQRGCTTGLEMEIIYVLQSIMKFKINMLCTNLQRGEKQEDGNWTYLLGLLKMDQCHFVVGGFFPDNDFHEDFGVTSTYMQDTYTWYTSQAPLQAPWKGLIKIFKPDTWLLFTVVFVVAALSWYLFGSVVPEDKAHKQLAICFINTWAVFLGVSANNRPDLTPLRIFFIILSIYALNTTTIYTSKLISVFTEPAYDEQIDSIGKILAAGLPIGGREEYRDWFINDNVQDEIVEKLYNSSESFQPNTRNLKKVQHGLQSMLMNRFYILSHKFNDHIFGIPGNVFSNPMEMIAERGFVLLPKFNRIINYMTDSGIMNKIYKDFLYNMTILENIRDRDHIHEISQIVLTVDHLQGAFSVLIVGYVLSVLVFLMELIISTKWFRNARTKIFNYFYQILKFFGYSKKKSKMDLQLYKKRFDRNRTINLKHKNLFHPKTGLKLKKAKYTLTINDKKFEKINTITFLK